MLILLLHHKVQLTMEKLENVPLFNFFSKKPPAKAADIIEYEKSFGDYGNVEYQLRAFLENIRKPQPILNKIALPDKENLLFVPIKDIIRCEAIVGYTNIYTNGGHKYTCSKTVKEYEDLLPPTTFFRVHSSHLINLNLIKKYFKGRGGYVEMEDGSIIEVANRRKEQFLACFCA